MRMIQLKTNFKHKTEWSVFTVFYLCLFLPTQQNYCRHLKNIMLNSKKRKEPNYILFGPPIALTQKPLVHIYKSKANQIKKKCM